MSANNTPAPERVRGLANTLAITEDYEAISRYVRTRFAGEGGWLVADCGACAHDDGPKVAEFIAAACNFVRSDEFDALVRDAMRYRHIRNGPCCFGEFQIIDGVAADVFYAAETLDTAVDQAIDAERGGG